MSMYYCNTYKKVTLMKNKQNKYIEQLYNKEQVYYQEKLKNDNIIFICNIITLITIMIFALMFIYITFKLFKIY